ncbi:hypothetical protein Tco_1464732, partial [Tanacetum coccineum]
FLKALIPLDCPIKLNGSLQPIKDDSQSKTQLGVVSGLSYGKKGKKGGTKMVLGCPRSSSWAAKAVAGRMASAFGRVETSRAARLAVGRLEAAN